MDEKKAEPKQGVQTPRVKFGGTGVYIPPPEPKEPEPEKVVSDGERPED